MLARRRMLAAITSAAAGALLLAAPAASAAELDLRGGLDEIPDATKAVDETAGLSENVSEMLDGPLDTAFTDTVEQTGEVPARLSSDLDDGLEGLFSQLRDLVGDVG